MNLSLYFLVLFALMTSFAKAETVGCNGEVDHVTLEEGHDQPYPVILIPDIGEYGETRKVEWNSLFNPADNNPLTVHCYPTKNSHVKYDVPLPDDISKCVFDKDKKQFWCE